MINKSGGHATTSVLAGTDHAVVKAAPPKFIHTQGLADNGGISGKTKSGATPYKK